MRRITQILFSGLGGHAAVAFGLARRFRQLGVEPTLLFFGVEPLLEQHRERCRSEGLDFLYVAKTPGLALGSQRQIYAQLLRWRPGLVLTHGGSAGPAALAYRCLHRARWVVRETQANHLKSRRERWLAAFSHLLADRLVLLTPEYQAELLQAHRGWGRERTLVIPNGLDLEQFRPGDSRSDVLRLGMVSRVNAIKDHPTLLRALALADLPPWQLEVAGDGPERSALEQLTAELGLQDRVRFRGVLNEVEIAAFLRELDLYVHATHGETMSTAILQAMGSGLPILASAVPGVANMLEPDVTGWLEPAGQPERWARSLEHLAREPQVRQRLGRTARERAQERYSLEVQAQRYLALYPE